MQAANCLEDAVSVEGFRLRVHRKSSGVPKTVKPARSSSRPIGQAR
jgi:hypothetical protein